MKQFAQLLELLTAAAGYYHWGDALLFCIFNQLVYLFKRCTISFGGSLHKYK